MSKVIKRGAGMAPTSARPTSLSPPRTAKKPIIEREEVDARHRAHAIIGEAEERAQRILDDAEEQADQTRQRGYEEGREEGRAEFTQQITKALLGLDRLAQALEPSYVRLVRTCVSEIIGEALKMTDDAIVEIVRRALRDTRQQREVIVRVNPDDVEMLRRNERRLLEMLARANTIDIREDPTVDRGGCIVVTELGTIDATLDKQLDALEAALETELADAPSDASNAKDGFGSSEEYDR
ncbi:MAG: type III secretion system stator protein SctL [Deltaproteobacteria bacterium]|nr:type III secretion system stator protein SctL [Deltaproteobacteria bacterium]